VRGDIRAVLERDPASRNALEVILCYPGLWALWSHRVAHRLWRLRLRLAARIVAQWARMLTGIDIHPAATIGPRLFIDHGTGVVIGETAEIGADVTLYHGVTLGGSSLERGKRHPTLGDRVVVGAGAKILGAITIGEGSRIGANAVVVRDVPPDVVVVGVPGEIVRRGWQHGHAPNLEHGDQPDVIAATLRSMIDRVAQLEHRLGDDKTHDAPFTSSHGEWQATEDFVI
jgi:serine O-acetyltransferase